MVRRHNRLFVALHVAADASAGVAAFLLAYWVRFHSGLIAVTKGYPPFEQYLWLAPLVGVLVPMAFHLHGIYRLRRGRSRIDDFFGVLVGSVLAVVARCRHHPLRPDLLRPRPVEGPRGVRGQPAGVGPVPVRGNVGLTFVTRVAVRDWMERRWRAGIGLKRVLVAGSGTSDGSSWTASSSTANSA